MAFNHRTRLLNVLYSPRASGSPALARAHGSAPCTTTSLGDWGPGLCPLSQHRLSNKRKQTHPGPLGPGISSQHCRVTSRVAPSQTWPHRYSLLTDLSVSLMPGHHARNCVCLERQSGVGEESSRADDSCPRPRTHRASETLAQQAVRESPAEATPRLPPSAPCC